MCSILATDYPNFEVIFIDDSSTDGSFEYVKERFNHDKRLKLIRNPRRLGLATSRNIGIRLAKGEYVAFVETDMMVEPRWLREALKVLNSDESIGAVYCKVRDIDEKDRIQAVGLRILPHTGWVVNIGLWERDYGQYDEVKDTMAGAVGLIVKRKVLERIVGFDEGLTHNIDDIDFCWRIWIAGHRIAVAPKAIVYHKTFKPSRVREITISRSASEYHFNKATRMLLKNYEARSLIVFLPACILIHLIRALVNMLRGNVVPMISFLKAQIFFLVNMNDNIMERRKIQKLRRFSDKQIFKRFSLGLSEYLSYTKRVTAITLLINEAKNDKRYLILDIGAGENPRGDINVDLRRVKGVNVVSHALYLPFRSESFGHIYLSHVLEHFTYNEALKLLSEANRVLRKGGAIEIWIPNFQALPVLFSWLRDKPMRSKCGALMVLPMLSGDQDYAENVHKSLWTLRLLKIYLYQAGFKLAHAEGESRIPLLRKFLPNRCVVIRCIAKKLG